MAERLRESEVASRLPYLLIFRAGVATLLLVLNVIAEAVGWRTGELSVWIYAVVIATYVVVLVLGALLRSDDANPMVLGAAHLATAIMTTVFVVQLTGGIQTPFSFLYLLVILDGAIIGGRSIALVVATFSVIAYGAQLAMQLYGFWASPIEVTAAEFLRSFLVHGTGFYAIAFLSGYLAHLIQSAREEIDGAQDVIARVERQQREVLESLPVGVLILTEDTRVVRANQAAMRLLGADGLIGEFAGDSMNAFLNGTDRMGEVMVGERTLWATRARATPIRVDTPLHVLVLEDRSEIRALENELRRNERLASLGALSAAMAHEIRNPLAGLSGAIELMLADPEDRTTHARLEKVVHREIQRLNKLITDFLSYARPVEPQKRAVTLAPLVRDIVKVAERDGRATGRALEVEAVADGMVWADSEQVRQVLWNLIVNALDASPEGGRVALRIEAEDSMWRVDVEDSGPGIAPEIRDYLYEPFRTTKPGGTGLGLALVHRIMESHYGRVSLCDVPGGGTRASVWWPAAPADVHADSQPLGGRELAS